MIHYYFSVRYTSYVVTLTNMVKDRLQVPFPSNFIIVPMVMGRLMDRIGFKPILVVKVNLTVTVMEAVRVNGPLGFSDI